MRLFDYINDRRRKPLKNINVANLAKNHGPFLDQLDSMKSLPVHSGCVNTIEWNKTGEYILSGSDDKCLCITRVGCLFDRDKSYTVLQKIPTSHLGNIFSAKFLPNSGDSLIASCSSNGPVIVTDVNAQNATQGIYVFNCHTQSIFDVVPINDDDRVFLTCSEDSTVRLFDLRCHRSCLRSSTCPHPALIRNSHAITKITIHPLNSNMVLLGRADAKGLVYDRRKLPNPADFSREQAHVERMKDTVNSSQKQFQFLHPLDGVVSKFCVPGISDCRFTSLCFSPLGDQVLASFTKDDIYLFNYDKNARVELDQTLNKPTELMCQKYKDDNHQDNHVGSPQNCVMKPGTSDQSNLDNVHDVARRNHMIRNKERRMGRPHRIRLHGDWSDTGVDSTPASDRSGDRATMESLTNQAFRLFVRQGSQSAFVNSFGVSTNRNRNRNDNDNDNDNATNSETSSTANNNNRDSIHDYELYVDEEDEEDDEHEIYLDIDESGDHDDDDDNFDDGQVIHEEDISMDTTGEPLLSNSTSFSSSYTITDSRVNNDKNNVTMTSRSGQAECPESATLKRKLRETPPPRQQSTSSNNSQSRGISAETRMKFRKATEVIKNRYKNIDTYNPRRSYFGHRNRRTIIKQADFWGDDYVMSGSDCGRIFFWEKESGEIVSAFKGDAYVVNRLAANPNHYALASSGIDYDIKIWSTQFLTKKPLKPSEDEITKIIENNENMLDETMSTLTIPPQLFFRFLATLTRNHNAD